MKSNQLNKELLEIIDGCGDDNVIHFISPLIKQKTDDIEDIDYGILGMISGFTSPDNNFAYPALRALIPNVSRRMEKGNTF
jgi:hypothetical protein